jgi:membrane associated rhomboid family serine protease
VSSPAQQVPTCYRHDDRETYIRCVRCDRPICPDCMTSASVGFQCPECLRQGQARVRQPRTITGGRVRTDVGLVTRVLIGIDVAVFIAQFVYGIGESAVRFGVLGFAIYDQELHGVATGEYYRLITAAFLHGSILHLLLNMYVLYVIGTPVEAALGRVRYLTLYLLSAFGGCVASYAFNNFNTPSVGASGAIFGLFGAFLVISHHLRRDLTSIAVLIGINLAIGFLPGTNIDWRAHVGGLITGALLTLVFVKAPARSRTLSAVGAAVAIVAVCAVLVAMRTAELRDIVPFL